MKTCLKAFLLVWIAICPLVPERVLAQTEGSVHLSQVEIKRLVYGSHLALAMEERPELEAAVLVLLELDRRNPEAGPAALANLVGGALEGFRSLYGAADYRVPSRDEVIARFLNFLVSDSAHAKLRPASLSLLNHLLEDTYLSVSTEDWPLAWNQRTVAMERGLAKRQAAMDAAVARAFARPAFAACLDHLLFPETAVSVYHSPAEIVARVPALGTSPTLQWLLGLHEAAGPAGIKAPISLIEDYFAGEMANMRATIEENQNLHKAVGASQPDLAEYLNDEARVAAMEEMRAQVQADHAGLIAASAAAAHSLSYFTAKAEPNRAEHMITLAHGMGMVARGFRNWDSAQKLGQLAACTNFVSAGLVLVGLILDTQEDNDTVILGEIDTLKGMIVDLADHIDYRFDRVDNELLKVLVKLDESILAINQVGADLIEVRRGLLNIQESLTRLEQRIFLAMDATRRGEFIERINLYLEYEATGGTPLTYESGSHNYRAAESFFYTWATSHSRDAASTFPAPSDLSSAALLEQLEIYPLAHNLNYIRGFLKDGLGVGFPSMTNVANPRVWFLAADAYLKLAVENPLHFRRIAQGRINDVIEVGNQLDNFLGSITLRPGPDSKPVPNTELFDAVLDYYAQTLDVFLGDVAREEARYGEAIHFNPALWHAWEAQAAPVSIQETVVESSEKRIRLPNDVIRIAAGFKHFLALRGDGKVFAWGNNELGQCDVPEDLTDVIEISAGQWNNLALRSDGTVVAWGSYGNLNEIPDGLTNVVAISAGWSHNLALRSDGTVVAWGNNSSGQCDIPDGLTDVAAIATGGHWWGYHSLALRNDGSVVAWGSNAYGQCNVPQALAAAQEDVVGIAASGLMSAAVLRDGGLIGWPVALTADATVKDLSLGGTEPQDINGRRAVALTKQGTVEVLWGSRAGAPQSNDIVQVTAGGHTTGMLALHADGTLTAWGVPLSSQYLQNTFRSNHGALIEPVVVAIASNDMQLIMLHDDGSILAEGWYLQEPVPADLPPAVAVAAGAGNNNRFFLALLEDGTVRGWGGNAHGEVDIPVGISNVVAIAAGGLNGDPYYNWGGHSLALRKDGTVVAWGDNTYGKCNVPADLSGVVAVSAGQSFSLALLGAGTVRVWGDDRHDLHIVPPVNDIVAISAGFNHSLALRADGTVVAWGSNGYGKCDVPADLSNVVAVEAGELRSLALQADGTVRAWGYLQAGRVDPDNGRTGVVMMSTGSQAYNNYLVAPAHASVEGTGPYPVRRHSRPSSALASGFQDFYTSMVDDKWFQSNQSIFNLSDSSKDLAAAKKLLDAVVSLGLSYSLEHDDALRGFLFGSEPIPEPQMAVSDATYQAEAARLGSSLWVRPRGSQTIMWERFEVFRARLDERLKMVADTGKPEIPRMVGHTLGMLKVLSSARLDGTTPLPVLELSRAASPAQLSFMLHGEPYIHYQLEQTSNLSHWTVSGFKPNDGDSFTIGISPLVPSQFYRVRRPPQN